MRVGEIALLLSKNLILRFTFLIAPLQKNRNLAKPHKNPSAPLKHANVIFYPDNTLPF